MASSADAHCCASSDGARLSKLGVSECFVPERISLVSQQDAGEDTQSKIHENKGISFWLGLRGNQRNTIIFGGSDS